MAGYSKKYKVFTVSESELLAIDDFAEEKYIDDEEVRACGFFKAQLSQDAKRKTTLEELITRYKIPISEAVKQFGLLKSPLGDTGLYAMEELLPGSVKCKQFTDEISNPKNYMKNKSSCCEVAYNRQDSVETAFTDHFFDDYVAPGALGVERVTDVQDMRGQKGIKLYNDYEKLKSYKTCYSTPEERHEYLVGLCMAENEKVDNKEDEHENEDGPHYCVSEMCMACAYGPDRFHYPDENTEYHVSYSIGVDENDLDAIQFTENYSMKAFARQNLLALTDSAYAGISFPQLYVGTKHSFFPVHIEDSSFWSINIVFFGGKKCWYVVPPESVDWLTKCLIRDGFHDRNFRCTNILGHKHYLPSTKWLNRHKIPFTVVFQEPGEIMVLLPNSAHFGVNLGTNIAQSVNFTTPKTLPYALMYPGCTCLGRHAVHQMDVRNLIAAFWPQLMAPYMKMELGDVVNLVNDEHFRRSLVSCRTGEEGYNKHVKCPWCEKVWLRTSLRRPTVESHIKRRHPGNFDNVKTQVCLSSTFKKRSRSK